jgi:hypothetical protein
MRYSWSQATLNRMLRATERAGLSVSCVEITRDGKSLSEPSRRSRTRARVLAARRPSVRGHNG